jgi:hypothetical protein
MRVISIFLGLINSLLAGLLITFLITSTEFKMNMASWSAARIWIALSIIVIGVLSWISMVMPIRPVLLVLGSLFLVATGPAAIVWTYHRASVTGDMKYYMLMYGASLFVQGCSLLFGLSEQQDPISAA